MKKMKKTKAGVSNLAPVSLKKGPAVPEAEALPAMEQSMSKALTPDLYPSKGKKKAPTSNRPFGKLLDMEEMTKAQATVDSLNSEMASFTAEETKEQPPKVYSLQAKQQDSQITRLKAKVQLVTLNCQQLFSTFEVTTHYPLEKVKDVISMLMGDSEFHLDFTGVRPLTDAVFAIMAKSGISHLSKVRRLTLTACQHITDRGMNWICQAFPNLNHIDVSGCPLVTEIGIGFLCNLGAHINVKAHGTGVHSVPVNMAFQGDGCPLLADNKSPKKEMNRVLVVKRDAVISGLVLFMNKESNLKARQFAYNHTVPGKKNTLNIVEVHQSVMHLFLCSRLVVVLPTELQDKTKIAEEAVNLSEIICRTLAQVESHRVEFIILGLNSSQAGVVPPDFLVEEIGKALKKTSGALDHKTKLIQNPKSMEFAEQEELAQAVALQDRLANVHLTSAEINISNPGKDIGTLTDLLAAKSDLLQAACPEYSEGFPASLFSLPDKLAPGAHSMHAAASQLTAAPGNAAACIHLLNVAGPMCKMPTTNGMDHVVMTTKSACDLVNQVMNTPAMHGHNEGQLPFLADSTSMWLMEPLTKGLANRGIKAEAVPENLDLLQKIGLGFPTPQAFFTLPLLETSPPCPLEDFQGHGDQVWHVTYTYLFGHPLMEVDRLLAMMIGVLRPLMLWRHGAVFQEGLVEVLIQLVPNSSGGSSLGIVAQTEKRTEHSEDAVTMLWSAVEQWKLIVDTFLQHSGLTAQTMCESSAKKPDIVDVITSGHLMNSSPNAACRNCGMTRSAVNILKDCKMAINKVYPEEGMFIGRPETQLDITDNLLVLTGPCQCSIRHEGLHDDGDYLIVTPIKGSLTGTSVSFRTSASKEAVLSLNMETGELIHAGTQGKGKKGPTPVKTGFGIPITCRVVTRAPSAAVFEVYVGADLVFQNVGHSESYLPVLQGPSEKASITLAVDTSQVSTKGYELRPGMKLEALDRKTPRLICVATIVDVIKVPGQKDKVHIYFDGWSNHYDYLADVDSVDIHPLGWFQHIGHTRQYDSRLQAPKGYTKPFTWRQYLEETESLPVPYHFFTPAQHEGTPIEHTIEATTFGKNACVNFSNRSCVLDVWLKSELEQVLDDGDVFNKLSANRNLACIVLPRELTSDTLRFPAFSQLVQLPSLQLHFLCTSQKGDYHLGDHPGISLRSTKISKPELLWKDAFLPAYITLLLQERSVPTEATKMCPVLASIPQDKIHRVEFAMKRLYKFYILREHFPVSRWSSKLNTSVRKMPPEIAAELKKILDQQLKDDEDFSKTFFPGIGENDPLQCLAHKTANSSAQNFTEFPVANFPPSMASRITKLDFFQNGLTALPPDFFKLFSNLAELFLVKNKLTELPSLDGVQRLMELDISFNSFKQLKADFGPVSQTLLQLNISQNPLGDLPKSLEKCTKLIYLNFNNIGHVRAASLLILKNLTELETLMMESNGTENIPDELAALTKLKHLRTSGLSVTPIMPWPGRNFTHKILMQYIEFWYFYTETHEKEITELFNNLDKEKKGFLNQDEISELNIQLMKKYPRLTANKVGDDILPPPVLWKLKNLERLEMAHQAFTCIPDDIKQLTKLTHLELSCNMQLTALSAELGGLPLQEIHLRYCSVLKTPPPEIVSRGFLSIYGYLKRLLQGSVACKRTKLMMVGLGGAGKTSLVRALTRQRTRGRFEMVDDQDEMITDGIDITNWKVDIKGESEPLTFGVWDFAGQTVYYNTHQFFLSNRAVYLLLWNIRLGYEHAGLDFWLSSIACHAPQAPILVVGTHCDKVEKSRLPEEELRRRYPQICGFHFVSSYTGQGVAELREDLLAVTLKQKYMGEKIPEAYLTLEERLTEKHKKEKVDLLPYAAVERESNSSGIFDKTEVTEALQFLHDLGSIQFFNTPFLRSHVVINPQWIVDVMACVVTVHVGPIKDGKFVHKDMAVIWKDYPKELHPWLLRLTEEFDLTFPLSDEEANIVPCLLPTTEPKIDWPKVDRDNGHRETKMIYHFAYLPAGLFNRAQVRLHQFSDSSILWKKGSLLKKSGHVALMQQTESTQVVVKVQGYKPENTLFLVHEVFECLIAESYKGVQYDFAIPCMECQQENVGESCMFLNSKIQRALEMKAPFLQCDTSFHIISISELQSQLPPVRNSDFDEHLGRSVRELHDLEEDTVINTFFVFSKLNVPMLNEDRQKVHPMTILEDMRKASFRISYTDVPEIADMETLTMSLKSAQVVLIGISDEFVSTEQCRNLVVYTKETLNKPILLVVLGQTMNWQKTDLNLILGDEVFVKMNDVSRYPHKIKELEDQTKVKAGQRSKNLDFPKCFVSYAWANSADAVAKGSRTVPGGVGWGDPRKLKTFLSEKGISCWLDIERMGQMGFFQDLADGLRKAKVVVACVSDEYAKSKNCAMEFRFASATLKLPIILAVVGTGYEWERSEIGLIAVGQGYPKVNLQYDNPAGQLELFTLVQQALEKQGETGATTVSLALTQRQMALQEVLELTQRKFLRHLISYMEVLDIQAYPRLITLDFADAPDSSSASEAAPKAADACPTTGDAPAEGVCPYTGASASGDSGKPEQAEKPAEQAAPRYCFRLLCEHEEGWHPASTPIPFPQVEDEDDLLRKMAPYLARILAILRHTALPLNILTTPQGLRLIRTLEDTLEGKTTTNFKSEYGDIVKMVMERDPDRVAGKLKRCHMPNGKALWLCADHQTKAVSTTAFRYNDQLNKIFDSNEDNSDPSESVSTPAAEAYAPVEEEVAEAKSAPKEASSKPPLVRTKTAIRRQTSQACAVM